MQCPACGKELALAPNRCNRCGRKLKPLSQQIPLSKQQRQALRSDIVVLSIALFVLVGIFGSLALALNKVPMFIWPIAGLLIIVVGWHWLNRIRDLLSGHAQIKRDQLKELSIHRSGTGSRFYAHFKTLGSQQLQKAHFDKAIQGKSYSVIYSPQSKIVWELAPLNRSRELA